jgi:hypothetical protein
MHHQAVLNFRQVLGKNDQLKCASMTNMSRVGRVTGKAMLYFLTFSSLALVVGMIGTDECLRDNIHEEVSNICCMRLFNVSIYFVVD